MRITVVTSGHLSTCPRMLKSADALAAAGHDVRVVATRHEPWAVDADADVRSRRSWPLTVVDYRRGAGATYWRSGIRYRASRMLSAAIGPERLPLALASRAFGRVHPELVKAAHAASMTVTSWTFKADDDKMKFKSVREEMEHFLYTLGIDALFTNNPDQFPRR